MPGTGDFLQYWVADRLLLKGENPYDEVRALEMGSTYRQQPEKLLLWLPPWVLVFMQPFLHEDFFQSARLWMGCNLVLLFSSCLLLQRDTRRNPLLPYGCCLFLPCLSVIHAGQVGLLMTLGVILFLRLQEEGKHFFAGCALMPLTLKFHFFLPLGLGVLFWMYSTRRWKLLLGFTLSTSIALALTSLLSTDLFLQWLQAIQQPPTYYIPGTLSGLLRQYIFQQSSSDPRYLMFLIPLVFGISSIVFLQRKSRICWQIDGPILLCLSALGAPYGWFFDCSVLLPCFYEIFSSLLNREIPPKRRLYLFCGVMLLTIFPCTQIALGMKGSQYLAWFPLAVLILMLQARKSQRAFEKQTL